MKARLARFIQPDMCGEKLRLVMSTRNPDRLVNGKIQKGETHKLWQTCGQRPGHPGEHGGWGRGYRWRLRLANWLEP